MTYELPPYTWSIGGGKGGVGRSFVSLALAYWLGRLKKRVVLIDADLCGANLHTMLGIRIPEATLADFHLRKVGSLEDILLKTSLPNVRLLAGASDIPSLADPSRSRTARILRALEKISADVLLVDLGPGATRTVLDFFLASPHKLVVMRPQPTSVQNTYAFIRAALFSRLERILRPTALSQLFDEDRGRRAGPLPQTTGDVLEEVSIHTPEFLGAVQEAVRTFRIQMIVNMLRKPGEEGLWQVVGEVCRRYLELEVDSLGSIPHDPSLERWASRMGPGSLVQEGTGEALRAAYDIAYSILTTPGLERMAA